MNQGSIYASNYEKSIEFILITGHPISKQNIYKNTIVTSKLYL